MSIDPKSISLLTAALTEKRPIFLSGDQLSVTFETKILAILPDAINLFNSVPYTLIQGFKHSKTFSLQVGMTRFQADKILSNGEHLVFPLSADSAIEETRQYERFTFNATEEVMVEIINPFDQETLIVRPVMDMSKNGLSFRTSNVSELFKRGRYLPQITVKTDGEPYRSSKGTVVYSREVIDTRGRRRIQVGIKFED